MVVQKPINFHNSQHGGSQCALPPIIQDLIKNVLGFVTISNGSTAEATFLLMEYINNRIPPNTLISTFEVNQIYAFTNAQKKLLYEYGAYMNTPKTQYIAVPGLQNVHQSAITKNTQTNVPNVILGSQKVSSDISFQSNFGLSQPDHQALILNNNVTRSAPSNLKKKSTQLQESGTAQIKLIDLEYPLDRNLLPKKTISEESHDSDEENFFEICGTNIKDEEKLFNIIELNNQMIPCQRKIQFDHSRILSMLVEHCQTNKLNLTQESAESIVMTLSMALEVKLRNILQRATTMVHHKLRNFDVKGQKYPGDNIEQKVVFIENVLTARDATKLPYSRTNIKKGQKKPNQSESQSQTNDVLMAALKGGVKIENVIFIKSTSPVKWSNLTAELFLKYTAQRQRKIFKRDLVQILEKEHIFKKYLKFCN
ncbi:hypothetical protein RF11_00823 [Thelohanellus kitauei]|uniref:Transcription initiation factor TFIID subunit 4 n=1 Tax=Thelohanellus kitauei TaxID=669202 RepID=A0A0C2MRI4_THEKT|nr:hypothetical protein RF11_00823 [Thelohanellus kitauei]